MKYRNESTMWIDFWFSFFCGVIFTLIVLKMRGQI